MSSFEPCKRTGQAEAARDGRFDAQAAEAFQLHLLGCAACMREQAELDALGHALRAPETEASSAALRSLREQVLSEAAADVALRKRARRAPTWVPASALAAAALILGYGGAHAVRLLRFSHLGRHDARRGSLVINAGPSGANWTQHRTAHLDQIELRDGTLNVDVQRRIDDPRVVVRVPEGEIEDVGTVFSVTVRAGKTTKLSVSEGRVMWKRRGEVVMTLAAGTSWQAPVEAPPVPAFVTPPVSSVPAVPLVSAKPMLAPKTLASSRLRTAAVARASRVTPEATPARVQQEATGDGAEDAMYLQLMALLHEGRNDEARLLAAKYLKAFPSGFRRKEVAAAFTPH